MSSGSRQRGAGAVEFIVVFLSFAALITGLLEMTRVYRSKHTLNNATFQAARAGAVHHARGEPMEAELANNMAPLYSAGQRSPAGLGEAITKARAMTELPGVGIEIISPTQQIFDQLHKQQWIRRSDENDHRWQEVIPNDNLRLRPRQSASMTVEGSPATINLQDANLLKVHSLWCHRLIVPALDRVIFGIVNLPVFVTDRQRVCSAISGADVPGIASGFYLPVVADAAVRMQSAVVADDLR